MTNWNQYLLLGALAANAAAQDSAEHPFGLNRNHPYGVLSTDYVTRHVAWARPYARGKTKVLVLAPEYSQRETVELAQRLSLDFRAWMSVGFSRAVAAHSDQAAAAFLPPAEVVYRSLRECVSKEYDAIIVGKLVWSIIPPRERFELLKKVAEGTGLVYVNPPEDDRELELVLEREQVPQGRDFITANLPLRTLPRFRDKDLGALVSTCMFGKGRVVVLDYQEEPPPDKLGRDCAWPSLTPAWDLTDSKEDGFVPLARLPEMELVPYEYYQALVARAVLWAAKKETEVKISQILLDETVDWPARDHQVQVELERAPPRSVVTGVVRDRYRDSAVYPLDGTASKDGARLRLPDLPAGRYFLDVWVRSQPKGTVLTWGSKSFEVRCEYEFGPITLSKALIERGDKVSGTIALPRLTRENEQIQVSLWDNYDRRIATTQTQNPTESLRFSFDPFEALTICHRIEVRLLRDGRVVTTATLDFPIRARRRWDDFNSVIWSGGENHFITHHMLRKLAAHDQADSIDIGWRGATVARNIAMADLSHTPYTARYGCFGKCKNNIVRSRSGHGAAYGCMSSPVTLGGLDKWGEQQSRIYGPYGPFVWTHGDETNYAHHSPDVCWSRTCMEAFRKLLTGVYADVGELNRKWKTSYAAFEEVMPLTFKEAKDTGNYAPWVTHRLSCDRVFAGFYRRSGEALDECDPKGRGAGFDGGVGLSRPNSGGDWWVLSKNLDLLHSYCHDSQQMEVFRSFAKPGQVTGMWYGTYGLTWQIGPNTAPYCHFFPWYCLFHGLNSTWFWTMGAPGYLSGYAPDLTSLPFFEARTEALRKIKSGVGKLLLHSQRQHDGIAVHFSEASRIAASFYAAKETDWCRAYPEALVNFNKALEDCGFQYEYLSYEEVAEGMLRHGGFKVLIMPQSRAISRAEAIQIRGFVRDGGIAIADIVPGILNDKGTRLETGLLAELFPSTAKGTVTPFGKGKTVLVGDLLSGYGKAHMDQFGWAKLQRRGRLLGEILEREASLRPTVRTAPLAADDMPPTEITRFRCGRNELVCLLREYFLYDSDSYAARITFPHGGHVYDVMAGKYLGRVNRVDTELSYRAQLYWLSSYKVRAVELQLADKAKRGKPSQVEIRLTVSDRAKPSGHCFRLEVLSPTGQMLAHYARNILAPDGVAPVAIPWALNDAPGPHRVRVTDVCTGVTSETTVVLE